MKTHYRSLVALTALAGFAFTASAADHTPKFPAAATKSTPAPAAILRVSVNVPPSMRPFVDDKVAEAFADRVTDALRRSGYQGPIHYEDWMDKPKDGQPFLAVNLIEWRTDHVGNVDCTFSARLTTPKGERELGLFTGTAMELMFPRHDWFVRSEQFDEAARHALNDLYQKIDATKLLAS